MNEPEYLWLVPYWCKWEETEVLGNGVYTKLSRPLNSAGYMLVFRDWKEAKAAFPDREPMLFREVVKPISVKGADVGSGPANPDATDVPGSLRKE